MTTQITKTYNPSGSGADNFTTVADTMAWVRSLDPVAADSMYFLVCSANITWSQDTAPISASDTQYLRVTAAAGSGPNDTKTGAFNFVLGPVSVTFNRVQYSLQISSGIKFVNINVLVGETGQATTILFKNHTAGSTYDHSFLFCRILDKSTSGSQSFTLGTNNNRSEVCDCLIITEKSDYVFRTITGGNRFLRNTVVGRNGGSGTSAFVISNYGGDTIGDNVLINTGVSAVANSGSNTLFNNFSNSGTSSNGVTVVTGAGVLVVSETTDFTPTAAGPLIGAASDSAKGTPDILGGNRGQSPDVGARQRVAAAALPTSTITSTVVTTTTGNKRRVTISGTTTGSPTSGLASITPTAKSGNNAVAQSNAALTLGSGTFTVFFDDARVGEYNEVVTVTNDGGSANATGSTTVSVVGATGTITSQQFDGQVVSVSGTTTGNPDSAAITWLPDPASTTTSTQGPFQVTLGNGTFSDANRALPAGQYLKPNVTFTISAGTSLPADGVGVAVTIMPINGNPEVPAASTAPPASTVTAVIVSPDGAVVLGGSTQLFTATVQGTNTPSQSVTWSKRSGVGSIANDGTYASPAATTSLQTGVFRATSIQDSTYFDDFTVSVSAVNSFVPKITIPLKLIGGAAAVNLSSIKWAWHDQATPDLFIGAPTDKGTMESTDSTGSMVILLPNSKKTASGQIGHIEITNSDGTTTTPYNAFVGPWAVD